MVKVNAPAMSLDASGSLAGAIVFSKWKGRNYVRSLVRPSNPKSVLQVAVRAMMKFLAQNWVNVAGNEKTTWDTLAKATSISAFNAYVSENMTNWRQHLAPSMVTPATRVGTLATVTAFTATGGYRQAALALTVTVGGTNWGAILHRTLTDVAPLTLATVIGVLYACDANIHNYTDTAVAPGTYYYWYHLFTTRGKLDTVPIHGTAAAIVT